MPIFKTIKFTNPTQTEFVKTLRKRVDSYFKENGITKTGGLKIKIKAVFMLCLYTAPYFLMLFGVISNAWLLLAMCILMGFGMAGIGLSVMHDANHGSFSRKDWLNKFAGFSINFLGGNVNNWKAQHNIMHHSFTNIHGYDEDIETGNILRLSPHSEKKWFHKLQFLYAWPLYGLMTLSWTFAKDFSDVYRYKRKGLLKQLKTTLKKEMTLIVVTRVIYFIYIVLVPLLIMEISWWQLIIGFLTVHFVAGLTLALIFQLAHVMEETSFPTPVKGSIKNQWAVHQLETTLNFANKNRVLSWLIGGLNFQIEHHLFPNISHIHYRKIAPIIEATAIEFNLPYYKQDNFRSAIFSHARLLYRLGK
ncbi:MAG: acyl-CoA desaturase [Flavobacteriales bacterium]|nr:acyl-CoA desaturase [Flavobacteriales bacterium]